MKSTQNLTIVLLLVTAAVLTGLLVGSYVYTGESAQATSAGVKGGNYIMVSGMYNQDSDFVYVLDIEKQKLGIYFLNVNTSAMTLGDTIDLAKYFGAAR
jgi:hypothetical protein